MRSRLQYTDARGLGRACRVRGVATVYYMEALLLCATWRRCYCVLHGGVATVYYMEALLLCTTWRRCSTACSFISAVDATIYHTHCMVITT